GRHGDRLPAVGLLPGGPVRRRGAARRRAAGCARAAYCRCGVWRCTPEGAARTMRQRGRLHGPGGRMVTAERIAIWIAALAVAAVGGAARAGGDHPSAAKDKAEPAGF